LKIFYFSGLEEIYNNVVPHWSAVLISRNHSITSLISFTKTVQIRDQFFMYMDPVGSAENLFPLATEWNWTRTGLFPAKKLPLSIA
jgi:hypothetical protein